MTTMGHVQQHGERHGLKCVLPAERPTRLSRSPTPTPSSDVDPVEVHKVPGSIL